MFLIISDDSLKVDVPENKIPQSFRSNENLLTTGSILKSFNVLNFIVSDFYKLPQQEELQHLVDKILLQRVFSHKFSSSNIVKPFEGLFCKEPIGIMYTQPRDGYEYKLIKHNQVWISFVNNNEIVFFGVN